MQKTLYGCISDNCCAYCRLHHCAITVKQMKKKECLKKQCFHLRKNLDHPIWEQRERIKEKKREKKRAMALA